VNIKLSSPRFSWIFILFLFFSQLTISAHAEESYEGKNINKLEIIESAPGTTDSSHDISASLKTKQGTCFSHLIFDKDLKDLSEKYDSVHPTITENPNGSLNIVIKVTHKPTIRYIRWKGNNSTKTMTLNNTLGLRKNQQYDKYKFIQALNKVKDYYLKKGYFESEISYHIQKFPQTNEVGIVIKVKEGKSGKIKKIIFQGFTKDETKDLKGIMITKEYNPIYSWLTGSGIYRQEMIEQDQLIIINYLQNKGYADAHVEIKPSTDPQTGKIMIHINAHRGTLYRLGQICFTGNSLISTEKIKESISIKSNEIFSPDQIHQAVQIIKDLYGEKGFIEVQISYDTKLKENQPIYDIHFYIEEGEKFKIGLIHVLGNVHTATNVILRESLLVPGELFDSRKLKATQARLENMGYFKNVNVYTVKSTEEMSLGSDYRDVYIEVEETTTGSANLFAGFSSLDNITGGLEITERNFNIRGLKGLCSKEAPPIRGGGEYLHAKGNVGKKQYNILLSWMDPYFRDSLWRLGIEGSITQSSLQSEQYDIKTQGVSTFISYPFTDFWTYGNRYRIRNSTVKIKGNESPDAQTMEDKDGLISAVNMTVTYDSTDNAYKATRGLRAGQEVEFAGVGGSYQFFKFSSLNAFYQPLWTRATLKLRAEGKFIKNLKSTSNVPMSERFFIGGENTVRGYKPYIIGPRILDDNNKPKLNEPKGGVSYALLSAEINQRLFPMIDLFAFYDAGYVSSNEFEIPKLNTSVGVGTRLSIMGRMPITLGYGWPINPSHSEDVQNFFFAMGAQF